ncbi:Synaptogenesis protein syg-2-like 8, partial [Homarus americanus]
EGQVSGVTRDSKTICFNVVGQSSSTDSSPPHPPTEPDTALSHSPLLSHSCTPIHYSLSHSNTPPTVNKVTYITDSPVWVFAPSGKLDVLEGGDLTITAEAAANPTPIKYSWMHETGKVVGEIATGEGNVGELKLDRVGRHMAGTYTVTATSAKGTIIASFIIDVQYGPENVTAASRVLVDQNDTATVLCSAVGNPTPNITWTRVVEGTRQTLSWGMGEAHLVVEWAAPSDTGVYYCHASNVVSSPPPATTAIVVTQGPTYTSARLEEEEVAGKSWALVGGSGLLDCRVKASPQPAFEWITEDGPISDSDRKYDIHLPQLMDGVAEWSSVLEIRNVVAKDFTSYICVAYNPLGSHTLNYTLNPPTHPGTPLSLNVTVLNDTSVELTWVDNTAATTTAGYTIRYRTTDQRQYELDDTSMASQFLISNLAPPAPVQLVDIPGTNTSGLVIEGLKPGTEYSFSIQSYNDMDMVEDKTDTEDRPKGMPFVVFVLIAVTGGVLIVLNVIGVLCFLRRRVVFRGFRASSTKSSAYEVPSPSLMDQLSLSSSDDIPPPDYEVTPPLVHQDSTLDPGIVSPSQPDPSSPLSSTHKKNRFHVLFPQHPERHKLLGIKAQPTIAMKSSHYLPVILFLQVITAWSVTACQSITWVPSLFSASHLPGPVTTCQIYPLPDPITASHPHYLQICPLPSITTCRSHLQVITLPAVITPPADPVHCLQQVMGSCHLDPFGGSLQDISLPSGSRGTPSLARSSPMLTSSSTISNSGADIIAPPDDFSSGIVNIGADDHEHHSLHDGDSWANLEADLPTCHQSGFERSPFDHLLCHQSSYDLPRPVGHSSASTFRSMESLLNSRPYQPQQTYTLPRRPSQVIFHGHPHLQHEREHYQQRGRHVFQYPLVRQLSSSVDYQQPQTDDQYFLQQQQRYHQQPSLGAAMSVPPPYASLDPSTLYSLHSTFFEDGARPSTSYSDSPTGYDHTEAGSGGTVTSTSSPRRRPVLQSVDQASKSSTSPPER